jgi:hypothetical protein
MVFTSGAQGGWYTIRDTYANFNKNNDYSKGRKDGNVARIK